MTPQPFPHATASVADALRENEGRRWWRAESAPQKVTVPAAGLAAMFSVDAFGRILEIPNLDPSTIAICGERGRLPADAYTTTWDNGYDCRSATVDLRALLERLPGAALVVRSVQRYEPSLRDLANDVGRALRTTCDVRAVFALETSGPIRLPARASSASVLVQFEGVSNVDVTSAAHGWSGRAEAGDVVFLPAGSDVLVENASSRPMLQVEAIAKPLPLEQLVGAWLERITATLLNEKDYRTALPGSRYRSRTVAEVAERLESLMHDSAFLEFIVEHSVSNQRPAAAEILPMAELDARGAQARLAWVDDEPATAFEVRAEALHAAIDGDSKPDPRLDDVIVSREFAVSDLAAVLGEATALRTGRRLLMSGHVR